MGSGGTALQAESGYGLAHDLKVERRRQARRHDILFWRYANAQRLAGWGQVRNVIDVPAGYVGEAWRPKAKFKRSRQKSRLADLDQGVPRGCLPGG